VVFSSEIQQHVPCPPLSVFENTVGETLAVYFESYGGVQPYIFDERGYLRPKIGVFIDGIVVQDRDTLSDPVPANARVFVFAELACREIN
jgi:hypothetical protein